MKAIILAAGMGSRLGGDAETAVPKALLRFGGRSLLARHLDCLARAGVTDIVVATGFGHDDIRRELAALDAGDRVSTVFNPDFADGSIVTLWSAREALLHGGPVLLMDADVLYPCGLLRRLTGSGHENCVIFDRDFEPGEEPFKVWVRDGEIVDFRKWSDVSADFRAEWVGFVKFSPDIAGRLAARVRSRIENGGRREPCEEALRDIMLYECPGSFGYEDITGTPWIEIDFPSDVARAEREILPRILAAEES